MDKSVVGFNEESLHEELELAKENLKNVDDNIKKLIGRDLVDPTLTQRQNNNKRSSKVPQSEEFRGRNRQYPSRWRGNPGGYGDAEVSSTKQRTPGGVFERLHQRNERPHRTGAQVREGHVQPKEDSGEEEEQQQKPALLSHVIATPKETKSREEVLAEQKKDREGVKRNRRMFGALLGTLQRFRQEETKLRDKEEKRARIEEKLEMADRKEKDDLRRERQDLFNDRKRKQQDIRLIELKMLRMKEEKEWEAKHQCLLNFIQTRTKPHIFYLPKIQNGDSEVSLVASQKAVAGMIEEKRKVVQEELKRLDGRRARLCDFSKKDEEDDQHRDGDEDTADLDIEDADLSEQPGVEAECQNVTDEDLDENLSGNMQIDIEDKENVVNLGHEPKEANIKTENCDINVNEAILPNEASSVDQIYPENYENSNRGDKRNERQSGDENDPENTPTKTTKYPDSNGHHGKVTDRKKDKRDVAKGKDSSNKDKYVSRRDGSSEKRKRSRSRETSNKSGKKRRGSSKEMRGAAERNDDTDSIGTERNQDHHNSSEGASNKTDRKNEKSRERKLSSKKRKRSHSSDSSSSSSSTSSSSSSSSSTSSSDGD